MFTSGFPENIIALLTSLRRTMTTAAVGCALALLAAGGTGCESTPDRDATAAEPPPADAEVEAEAETDDADDAEAEPEDALANEFEAFAERVEEAADAKQEPANKQALEVQWLDSEEAADGAGSANTGGTGQRTARAATETEQAVPNLGQELAVPEAADESAVAEPFTPGEPRESAANADEPEAEEAVAPEPTDVEQMEATELVEALQARLAEQRREGLRPWLAQAALTLADPQRELTDDDLGTLPSEDRKLVLAYQRMFTHLGRSVAGEDPDADREQVGLAAEELLEQLEGERSLTIATAELCRKVNGYGVYEPFERKQFVAGRERSAIVYVELDNFEAEEEADGRKVVRLRQEIVLYNASDGLAVWRVEPTEIVDRSRNRRRDFFLVQVVKLPRTLNVGRYLMKVTITDEVGEAVDEATIPVEYVAE